MLLGRANTPQDIRPDGDARENFAKINDNLRSLFDYIESLTAPDSPVLREGNLLGLKKSRLVATDRKAKLKSVDNLSDWVEGKKGEIVVKSDGKGGIKLSAGANIGGSSGLILDTDEYDEIEFTFTNAFLTQVVYKLNAAVVETVNITWNAYNQPNTVTSVIGGKTMTFSYLATGFPEEVVIT